MAARIQRCLFSLDIPSFPPSVSLSLSLLVFYLLTAEEEARPSVFQAQTTRDALPALPEPPAAVIGGEHGRALLAAATTITLEGTFWGGWGALGRRGGDQFLGGGNAGWQLLASAV